MNELIIAEIAIIDDCGVERFCIFSDDFICFIRNHTGWTTILGIHYKTRCMDAIAGSEEISHTIVVQVCDDLGKVLLGLLVKVGDGNAGGKNGVVWVLGGEVCRSLGSKVLQGISVCG